MAAAPVRGDPDLGIPDLIRRLTQDSKRLVADEVRLAKIDATDSLHRAARGVLWMALAFGVGVIVFVALTLFLTTLIGRLANGHMWIGALVTGSLEIGLGTWLVKRGISAMASPSYSLEASRNALADTANWVTSVRKR
ncbi:MAG: phage holin family protein [Gemmatimonadaceae bacterium]